MIRGWQPKPVSQELLRCQRFYEKSYDIDSPPGQNQSGFSVNEGPTSWAAGVTLNTGNAGGTSGHFMSYKRTNPSCTSYDMAGAAGKARAVTQGDGFGTVLNSAGQSSLQFLISSLPAGAQGVIYHWVADARL